MSEQAGRFFHYLAGRCASDRAAGACLRRSLSFPPGEWPRAFPYVEPFVAEANEWRRKMYYLAAGLWASARERNGNVPFGKAVCGRMRETGSESLEKRFLALLEADADQLPHRLRQICALLTDSPVDFASLLDGLLSWGAPGKRIQWRWARDFYSAPAEAAVTGDASVMAGAEDGA